MVAAYIFVGDSDTENIKLLSAEIGSFANANGVPVTEWIVERDGGKYGRKLAALIKRMKRGDTLYVKDATVLGKSMREIVDRMATLLRRGINLYGVNDGLSFDYVVDANSFLIALECASDIYSRMYSNRTKAVMDRKRKSGIVVGRPTGSFQKLSVLLENRDSIEKAIGEGVTYARICRQYKVSYSTFRRVREEARKNGRQL